MRPCSHSLVSNHLHNAHAHTNSSHLLHTNITYTISINTCCTQTSGPPLVWAAMGALTCALVLAMAACVSASYQSQQQQQQQIEQQQLGLADYGSTSNELPSPPNAFQAQQANGYQQQHHSGGQKSNKKIQIVYIKVPLAKLRPALGNNVTDIGPAAYSNQTSPSSSSNYTTQQRDNSK